MRVRAATASVAIALAGWPVVTAAAQNGPPAGVHADSPTGVEYQLPLERAREDANGGGSGQHGSGAAGSGSGGGSSDQAPLFGAGVTPPGGPGGSSGSGSGGGSSGGGSSGGGSTGGGSAQGGGAADSIPDAGAGGGGAAPVRTASRIADEGNGLLAIVGLVVAVLALATGLGLVLRRGLRRPGTP